MPTANELTESLFRAKWAACNLHMQLIRCIEARQTPTAGTKSWAAHYTSIEDRVAELGAELDVLRNYPQWPDEDESHDEP